MKRFIIILISLLMSVSGYAQETDHKIEKTECGFADSVTAVYAALIYESQEAAPDSAAKAEIAELQQKFEKDISSILEKALDKVRKEIDKCIQKAEKRQPEIETEEISNAEEESSEVEVEEKDTISVYTEEYWENQETQLKDSDSLVNISAFVDELLNADEDVRNYEPILVDMDSLAGRISKLSNCAGMRLKGFVENVESVKYAQETLERPYNRKDKDRALDGLDSLMFMTQRQIDSSSVADMKEGLRYYYFKTGNMLSLIQEIKDMHHLYTHVDSGEKEKADAQDNLQSSLSIDYNFRIIPYMQNLYEEIVSEIIKRDETGQYQFNQFDMNRLDAVRQELESVRKSN